MIKNALWNQPFIAIISYNSKLSLIISAGMLSDHLPQIYSAVQLWSGFYLGF